MRFVKQDKIFRENKLPERPPYAILHLMMLTRGFFALILAAVVSGLSLSAARAGETPDPRVRAYVDPVRVVWQTEARARDDGWPARARVEGAARLLAPKFGQVCEGPFGKAGGARLANGGEDAGLMLDFGRELHGGLQLGVSPGGTARARLRVRFGESVAEAMSSVGERGASNDHALRDFTVEVPSFGTLEVGCTGFRFVRLDLVSGGEVGLEFVRAVSLMRPMRRVGSFRSSDGRLDRVFETAVRTVHLCCQDYLWDGIKRDRLVWVGDMHPEMAVILNVFGAAEVVPRSLEYAIAVTPPDRWMNTMAPYTLWFVRNLAAWCRYTGRADLLRRHAAYFRATLAHVATAVSPDGEWTAGKFLDWPNQRNPEAVAAGMQGLLALACDDAADLLGRLGGGIGNLRKQACAMATRHRDARARRHQARTLILTGIDGVAHGDVGKQRVTCAAYRGHAACQLLLDAALEDVADDGAAHGVVELLHERARITRRNRLARAAQMHVHVDEARHEIRTCQVDDLGPRWSLGHGARSHPGDDATLNGHGHIGLRLHMLRTIQDGRIDKQRGTIGSRHIELLPHD